MVVFCNVGFFGSAAILAGVNEVGSVDGQAGWPLVFLVVMVVSLVSYMAYLARIEYRRKQEEMGGKESKRLSLASGE